MNETLLFIGYMLVLIFHIVMLILSARRWTTSLWITHFIMEIFSVMTAVLLTSFYTQLANESTGIFPYFGETLFSIFASFAYSGMFAISLVVWLIVWSVRKKCKEQA